MLFDTHAHLDNPKFDQDREEIIKGLSDAGVTLLVNASSDMNTMQSSFELTQEYDFIYASAGVHPHDTERLTDADINTIGDAAQRSKIVAIGEIGLDYHYDYSDRDSQKRRFRDQMGLARDLNLPVIIHDRESHEDCLNIVREFPTVRGVFHCYSGTAEFAKEVLRSGYMISFTGVVTFDNAKKTVETARMLPSDAIMIETDCPYLAPVPYRGKRNQPAYVAEVCRMLAQIRSVSMEEMAEITMKNAKRFFRI